MAEAKKACAVGLNHVALEVGDIEEALTFYGRLFDFKLRGKSATSAFIDLGDQFLALQKGGTQPADDGRHFGLVVDDKDAVRKAPADRRWHRNQSAQSWARGFSGFQKGRSPATWPGSPISLVPPNLMTPSCVSEKGKSRTLSACSYKKGRMLLKRH